VFELKRLSTSAIPAALAKAERYRLLNEPEEAQSICEDVLAADPDNFDAVRVYILALTDSFPNHDGNNVNRAQELVARLPSEYERAYYAGLVAERRARALLARSGPGRALTAGDFVREAMRQFERAEAVKPADNDDALLRWNACVRLLSRYPELANVDEERTAPVMLE
jgi:tetratricopeptide (TPR) repeat protein